MVEASRADELDLERLVGDLTSVNNLLPNQDDLPYRISPDTPAGEAIQEMKKRGLDQAPVLTSNNEVLGVFSFRAFAEGAVKSIVNGIPLALLPVDEFLEHPRYIAVEENISSVMDMLLADGFLLVASPRNYLGTLTPSQAAKGLHDIAQDFILIRNFELLLRAVIRACVPDPDLRTFIQGRHGKYRDLEDMNFSDYEKLISENWKYLEIVFGTGSRERVMTKLQRVREIRNAAFHFKHQLTDEEHETLVGHCAWLVRRAKQYNASRGGSLHG